MNWLHAGPLPTGTYSLSMPAALRQRYCGCSLVGWSRLGPGLMVMHLVSSIAVAGPVFHAAAAGRAGTAMRSGREAAAALGVGATRATELDAAANAIGADGHSYHMQGNNPWQGISSLQGLAGFSSPLASSRMIQGSMGGLGGLSTDSVYHQLGSADLGAPYQGQEGTLLGSRQLSVHHNRDTHQKSEGLAMEQPGHQGQRAGRKYSRGRHGAATSSRFGTESTAGAASAGDNNATLSTHSTGLNSSGDILLPGRYVFGGDVSSIGMVSAVLVSTPLAQLAPLTMDSITSQGHHSVPLHLMNTPIPLDLFPLSLPLLPPSMPLASDVSAGLAHKGAQMTITPSAAQPHELGEQPRVKGHTTGASVGKQQLTKRPMAPDAPSNDGVSRSQGYGSNPARTSSRELYGMGRD